MKTTIVSLFDDSLALDRAVTNLSSGGFDERVFDASIVSREVGHGVSPLFTPGTGPAPGSAGLAHSYPDDSREEVSRTFRSHLNDRGIPDDEVDAYVTNFEHGAKFVIVAVEPKRATEAMELLRNAGASRVDRHG